MKMKRLFLLTAFLAAATLQVSAQGWQDAYLFSDNQYSGTARSVALGNAMTALGGDIGALTFNPAGSAVLSYGQFTITPGFSLATSFAQGTPLNGSTEPFGFEDEVNDYNFRFKFPNFGITGVYNTNRSRGITRWTFGFVGNITNDYTNRFTATGTNGDTSFAAALASDATGISEDQLRGSWWQDNCPSWQTMAAYKAYLFNPMDGYPGEYVAVTEQAYPNGDRALRGFINQYYGQVRTGYKYDMLLNVGAAVNDIFYFGANLGMVSLKYHMAEACVESPEENNADRFNFSSLHTTYNYDANGSGVYLKVGALVRPFAGLRIGAAIQTPTAMTIRDEIYCSAESVIGNEKPYAKPDEPSCYEYRVTSPFRVDAGLAYTFGNIALLSVDYELCNYSTARLRNYQDTGYDDFQYANQDIQECLGVAHEIRAGFELKPIQELAIRAGYNYRTSLEVYAPNASHTKVSFGLGYSSSGSFFADLAFRMHWLPDEYLIPYTYYTPAGANEILTPEIGVSTILSDGLVTIGWRF